MANTIFWWKYYEFILVHKAFIVVEEAPPSSVHQPAQAPQQHHCPIQRPPWKCTRNAFVSSFLPSSSLFIFYSF
jgi:hypothetical protein